jgi:hypothetical protein
MPTNVLILLVLLSLVLCFVKGDSWLDWFRADTRLQMEFEAFPIVILLGVVGFFIWVYVETMKPEPQQLARPRSDAAVIRAAGASHHSHGKHPAH